MNRSQACQQRLYIQVFPAFIFLEEALIFIYPQTPFRFSFSKGKRVVKSLFINYAASFPISAFVKVKKDRYHLYDFSASGQIINTLRTARNKSRKDVSG